jgi:hypothetical protein
MWRGTEVALQKRDAIPQPTRPNSQPRQIGRCWMRLQARISIVSSTAAERQEHLYAARH